MIKSSIIDTIVGGCCIVYIALLSFRQLRRQKPAWLRIIDIFDLLPSWRLFAPNPHTWDYKIIVITVGVEGTTRRDLSPYGPQTGWSFLWNPPRHLRKELGLAIRQMSGNKKRLRRFVIEVATTEAFALGFAICPGSTVALLRFRLFSPDTPAITVVQGVTS